MTDGLHSPAEIRVPVPDPTLLTTEQLKREISGLQALIEARIDAIELRINHGRSMIEAVPDRINEEVEHLRVLLFEKFMGIPHQFSERDIRNKQTWDDSKVALAAAFQAAREAVAEQNKAFAAATMKSETAFAKQMDQLNATFSAQNKATDDKIDDIKARLNIIEGSKTGILQIIGVLASIGALLGVAFAILKT